MTATAFIAARGLHMAACLLLLCVCVFDRFLARPALGNDARAGGDWSKIFQRLGWAAVIVAIISWIFWFGAVASNMSGMPLGQSFVGRIPGIVWRRTSFGKLWHWRIFFWIGATIAIAGYRKWPGFSVWIGMLFAALLVGSLAWTGHGAEGRLGNIHLAADVVHLLCASCWPMGLAPLFWLIRKLILAGKATMVARLSQRFSIVSVMCVCVMMGTGIVNSLSLMSSTSDFFGTLYGRVLLAKISCFLVMVGIGAVNLLRLERRFSGDAAEDAATARQLNINVMIETILVAAVIALVAILGTLAPTFGNNSN
jgi:copper resistance protein D